MKETHTAKSHRRRQRKHKYPQGYQPWNKRVRVTPNGEQPDETDVSLRYFAQDGSGTELPADFETWTPAVAYIRESTEDLAERFGPAVQRAAIATYCRQHQIRIVDEFYDTDSGDIPLSSRPEGAALLKALKLQKAKAIVTLCLDRLARNEADAHATWKAFRYAQVDLHFARRGQQDDSIAGRMLFGIEATMAAVERELIRERTMKGRRRKLEENKWDGAAVAYGYVRAGRGAEATLVIDPETGPIVQRIFEWYVFGDQDGSPPLSMRAIAMRLRAMGVPRPGARYDGDTSNCQWVQAMVRRILRNSTYRGIYEHGKTIILPKEYDGQPYEERRAWRNPDEIIRVRLPDSVTLVSNAVWEAAQERMAHNREMKNRQRKNAHVYMLSGYIICPHCNRRLSGKTVFARSRPGQQADRYYYTCFDPEGACRSRSRKMPAEILDGLVLGLLQTELAEPRLSQNLEQLRARRGDESELTRDRITTLGKAIADEKKAIDRLVARFELTDDPEVIDSIERRLAERKRLLKGYRDELASAQAALEHIDLSDEQAETLYQLAAGILQRLEAGPSVEQVRAILSALKVQITLDLDAEPNVVKIEWCFGTESTRYIHRNNSGHVVGLSRPGGQLVALHDTPSQLGIQIFHVAP